MTKQSHRRIPRALVLMGLWAAAATAQAGTVCFATPELTRMPPAGKEPLDKFVAELTFAGEPDDAPSIEVLYSTLTPAGRAFMLEFLGSFRDRCRKAGDPPYRLAQPFQFFRRNGPPPASFKEPKVSLTRFLELMKTVPDERVSLSLDAMGCPFTVHWTALRPVAPNLARVLGIEASAAAIAAREPLLHWMASLEFEVSDAVRDRLTGESMDVRIPCGRIELGPASASTASTKPE